jgi:peroxiredoxin
MITKLKANFAPALTLIDFKGQRINLAGYQGQKHVVLVFNRSFG